MRKYPIKRVELLLEGIELVKLEEMKRMAISFRIAQADKKDLDKFLKE